MSDIGEKIAKEAIRFVEKNVPYQHRSTTDLGCDCTGLIIAVAKKLGYLLNYKLRYYPPDWNLHSMAGNYVVDELSKVADEIPKNMARSGDVLVFFFGRCPAHVGIFVSAGLFVHVHCAAGRCKYGVLRNSKWLKRWGQTFRLNDEKMAQYN